MQSLCLMCYRIVNQHDEAQDDKKESFIKNVNQIDSYSRRVELSLALGLKEL